MPLTKHNLIEAAKLVKNERAKDFLMLLSVPEHAKFLNDFFNGKADAEVAAYNQTTRNKIPRFSKSRYKETATHRALCKIRDHIEKIQKLEGKPQQKALIEFVNYLNKVPIQNVHNLYNLNGYTVSIITKAAREKILQGSTYSTLEECLKVKPEIQRPSILLKDQNTRQHSPMMKKVDFVAQWLGEKKSTISDLATLSSAASAFNFDSSHVTEPDPRTGDIFNQDNSTSERDQVKYGFYKIGSSS